MFGVDVWGRGHLDHFWLEPSRLRDGASGAGVGLAPSDRRLEPRVKTRRSHGAKRPARTDPPGSLIRPAYSC